MPQGRFKKSTVAVAAAIIVLFVVAAVVALLFFFGNDNGMPADGQAIVYKKGDGVYLSAAGEKVKITMGDDSSVLITEDNRFLIYTTPSAKVSKKYDIYACDVSNASKVKKGPVLIDYGVELSFKYSSGVVYYSKQDSNNLAITTYLYNLSNGRKTDIDFGINNIFVPSQGETIFYTKKFVDSEALYSFSPNIGNKELVKTVADVHFYDDGENAELLFETGSYNEGESELYRVIPGENPVQIATMVSGVLYDEYVAGGNLYYFTKKDTPTDWRGIIEDDAEESDSILKEPNKSDYTFIFGISIQYRLDMEKYQKKQLRDAIREYLNTEVAEEKFSETYNLYVRNNNVSKKIADGVEIENVFAVSKTGMPRIVFTSTQIIQSDMSISELSESVDDNSFDSVKPTVDKLISECIKKTGFLYADVNRRDPVELLSYDNKKAEFVLTDSKDAFFVKVFEDSNDVFTLYKQTLSEKAALEPEQLASSVINCKISGEKIWYQKNDLGLSSGDLYEYYNGETDKLETKISSFNTFGKDEIVFFKNFVSEDGVEIADFYIYNGKRVSDISKDVNVSSIEDNEDGVAFISEKDNGKLCIYSKNKLAEIDSEVYTILAY
ncbi:MAG: hypothetical protein IJF40_04545 [Clostridia bacterium]|nr:hypothetical protein [Clostridia bacterium]MBQ7046780.1 hypothetical protein [Oscillospiraceae bacterium]